MSLEANKTLVRRAYDELLERGHFDNIEDLIHDEFVDHTNPPDWASDRGGLLRRCIYLRGAFPDITVTFHEVVSENDTVMLRQTMCGTHLGDFFGIPPTGTRVAVTGSHLWRIKDGRIVEHQSNDDDLGLMTQLGALPAEAAPESTEAAAG